MNIECPACGVEVPTDVKLGVHPSDEKPAGGGAYLGISIDHIDYEPMLAHYAAHHPKLAVVEPNS